MYILYVHFEYMYPVVSVQLCIYTMMLDIIMHVYINLMRQDEEQIAVVVTLPYLTPQDNVNSLSSGYTRQSV